jgi:hypothetical protein
MPSKLDETTVLNLRQLRMSLLVRSFIHGLEADRMGCGFVMRCASDIVREYRLFNPLNKFVRGSNSNK